MMLRFLPLSSVLAGCRAKAAAGERPDTYAAAIYVERAPTAPGDHLPRLAEAALRRL
jgi:hypothetical protein